MNQDYQRPCFWTASAPFKDLYQLRFYSACPLKFWVKSSIMSCQEVSLPGLGKFRLQSACKVPQAQSLKLGASQDGLSRLLSLHSVQKSSHASTQDCTHLDPLGPCVRQLKIKTDGSHLKVRQGLDRIALFDREGLTVSAGVFYFDVFLEQLKRLILANAFPHLDRTIWSDGIVPPPSLLSAFAYSTARHMEFTK